MVLWLAASARGQQFSITSWGHKDGLPSTTVYAVAQTQDGYLWIGTGDGLIRFDGFQFVQVAPPRYEGRSLGQITALKSAKTGALVLGTSEGLLVAWKGSSTVSTDVNARVEQIDERSDHRIQIETSIRSLLLDERDLSFVSSVANDDRQIVMIPAASGRQIREIASGSVIRRVLHDTTGSSWIATDNRGIFRIAPDGSVQHFTRAIGLPSDHVSDLTEDREGNIWAGTQNGLTRLRQDKFVTYTTHDGLLADTASSLAAATGGGVWIGSKSGLEHFTGNDGTQKIFFAGVPINALLPLHDGALLLSTPSGIQRLEAQSSARLDLNPELKHVERMAQSRDGDVWLYDQNAGLWHLGEDFKAEPIDEPALAGQQITSMRGGERDEVWLGLSNGTIIQRPTSGSHVFTVVDGLPGGAVRFLAPEDDGKFWAATDLGLVYFDKERFHHWNRASGLPGDRVLWALPDPLGYIWVGYSTGVARISIDGLLHASSGGKALRYDFYDDSDGLKSNPEIYGSQPAAFTSDGHLWVTMSEGVSMIDPAHVHLNRLPPLVHILGFTVDGRSMLPATDARFSPHTRGIQITYTGISLSEPRKVHFRYRLDGFDMVWQDAGTRRNAFYTNLRPGRYRFQVMAENNDGFWSDPATSITFELLPAFYQTAWFLSLCIMAALSLAFAAYRYRLRMTERELRSRYEERISERTRIAQELHDNLVQELLSVSLQLEVADQLTPADSAARSPLVRGLELSRIALAHGRNALHLLRQKPLSRADIEATLQDTIRNMGYSPDTVHFRSSGADRLLRPATGEELLQIVREALRNALRHAGGDRISVTSQYDSRFLRCTVGDRGPGIGEDLMRDGKPGHFGIRGMRERAARIGATLEVNSWARTGTEWTLTIPAKIAYEPEEHRKRKSVLMRLLRAVRGRREM